MKRIDHRAPFWTHRTPVGRRSAPDRPLAPVLKDSDWPAVRCAVALPSWEPQSPGPLLEAAQVGLGEVQGGRRRGRGARLVIINTRTQLDRLPIET